MLLEPKEVRKPGLDEMTVGWIGNCALDGRAEFVPGGRPVLTFEDVRAPAHHLGERPVRDALPIREQRPRCQRKVRWRPSMYLKNSQLKRDLPIPAIPVIWTT